MSLTSNLLKSVLLGFNTNNRHILHRYTIATNFTSVLPFPNAISTFVNLKKTFRSAPCHQLPMISTMESDKNKVIPGSNGSGRKELIMQPYRYVMGIPKVEIRSAIIGSFNYWMNIPTDKVNMITKLFGMLYDSIVLVDDIEDNSDIRRGVPATHKIFGKFKTMVSAKVILFQILKDLTKFDRFEVFELYADSMLEHWSGVYTEIHWRDQMVCPTIAEYEEVARQKNQSGIDLVIDLMKIFSTCKKDFRVFSDLLGKYYQFQNDYCNLCEEKYWSSKGFGDDISEGKYTHAIIHAIHSGTYEGDIVFNIIRLRPKDLAMKKYLFNILEKLGSIEFARKRLDEVDLQLRKEIQKLGGNPSLIKFLDVLNDKKSDEVFFELER